MLVRVVTDEPWDVPADILAVPVLGTLAFDGPLAEIDRRAGGELSALSSFGEVKTERYATALSGAGENAANRLLIVGGGDPAALDRETVVRIAATAERRLGGRTVRTLAVWLDPLAAASADGAETVANLVARGIVEGATIRRRSTARTSRAHRLRSTS